MANIIDIHQDPVFPTTWDELVNGLEDRGVTGITSNAQPTIKDVGGGMSLMTNNLQSPNYKAGTNGWRLFSNGDVEFESGKFRGELVATTGTIGGWTIGATTLSSTNLTIDSDNEKIESANYVTGVSGFHISPGLVEAENIIARGTLKGTTFAYDIVNAIGGQLMVANADSLASDMTALDASTLTTKGDTDFAVNDILVIRGVATSGIQEEWLGITDISSAPTYTVTRDLAGSFAAGSNPAWKAGTPVVKQGAYSTTSGNKYTAPTLTGGTNIASPLTDLLVSDGAFKLNINDVDYDNIELDTSSLPAQTGTAVMNKTANNSTGQLANSLPIRQTFLSGSYNQLTSVALSLQSYGSLVTWSNFGATLYKTDGGHLPTGGAIATAYTSISSIPDVVATWNFDCLIEENTEYIIQFSPNAGGSYKWMRDSSSADGTYGTYYSFPNWEPASNNFKCTIKAYAFGTGDEIAALTQVAVRAATSLTETVTYDTDHFLITGVTDDYFITASSPTTGTDISGAGYFDLADGVSVQGGYGTGGWLRLIGEGTHSPYYSVFKRLSGAYDDYVETCRLGNLNGFLDYATDEYGIALGDTDGFLKYDTVDGLEIKGDITVPLIPVSSNSATSKEYVDGLGFAANGGIGAKTTSGSVNVTHGLGKTPKFLKVTAVFTGTIGGPIISHGFYNGTTQSCVFNYKSGNPQYSGGSNASYIGYIDINPSSGGNYISASSMGATTFTLTFSTNDNVSYMWEVYG